MSTRSGPVAPAPDVTAPALRRLVLEVAGQSGVGHIGSALSVVEILTALYGQVLEVSAVDDPDRDRFVLSKGHAALALYGTLHLAGVIDRDLLATYCRGDGPLGVHPDHRLPGVDFSTGSLGMGTSFGVGSALAARISGSSRRSYVLVSDAELNAGNTWEAIQLAGHHGLDGLTLIIDANGQQAFGYTRDVLDLEPLLPRFNSHGWAVREVDGHDEATLAAALKTGGRGRPMALVARTVAGKGVSFMEGRLDWHYLPLRGTQLQDALREQGPGL